MNALELAGIVRKLRLALVGRTVSVERLRAAAAAATELADAAERHGHEDMPADALVEGLAFRLKLPLPW